MSKTEFLKITKAYPDFLGYLLLFTGLYHVTQLYKLYVYLFEEGWLLDFNIYTNEFFLSAMLL